MLNRQRSTTAGEARRLHAQVIAIGEGQFANMILFSLSSALNRIVSPKTGAILRKGHPRMP
jgi:hypothetical protein